MSRNFPEKKTVPPGFRGPDGTERLFPRMADELVGILERSVQPLVHSLLFLSHALDRLGLGGLG